MRISFGIASVVASIALTVCCQSSAEEPMLFRASSFVSPAAEASLLTSAAKKSVGMRREDRFTKQVLIAEFNRDVIQSSTISLEMPDHSVYRFSGTVHPGLGTPGYFTWTETRMHRVQASAAPASSAAVTHTGSVFSPNSLELFFPSSREHVLGRLVLGTRRFELYTLDAKHLAMTEQGLNPNSPPIDVEPAGPRPPRLRTNPDWPRGLLTDKLKESISTSSIGASLSPEYCSPVTTCGAVTEISCRPETDGPVMYFDNTTGVLIMACGGSCMIGAGLPGSKLCTACPPPEWSKCKGVASGETR